MEINARCSKGGVTDGANPTIAFAGPGARPGAPTSRLSIGLNNGRMAPLRKAGQAQPLHHRGDMGFHLVGAHGRAPGIMITTGQDWSTSRYAAIGRAQS